MSKTVIIRSSNNQTTTVTTADAATAQQVLGSTEALTFFNRSSADISGAFSGINGVPIPQAFRGHLLQTIPNNNDVLDVSLNVASFGQTQSQADSQVLASAVPGTVIVKYNGGAYSLTLTGIQIGTTTVQMILNNPLVTVRFGLNPAQLSACDVLLEHAGSSAPVSAGALNAVKVDNGDTVWLQARAADDKGC